MRKKVISVFILLVIAANTFVLCSEGSEDTQPLKLGDMLKLVGVGVFMVTFSLSVLSLALYLNGRLIAWLESRKKPEEDIREKVAAAAASAYVQEGE
ncbi:MAG: hypothetical protein J7J21_02335 [Methanomicrobia archaeon]|nr:hypothetical protein [Methanomicrobia archaeon]